jgi:hypothetical protein
MKKCLSMVTRICGRHLSSVLASAVGLAVVKKSKSTVSTMVQVG